MSPIKPELRSADRSNDRISGHRWSWAALAVVGLGAMIWQNHTASRRAEELAERIEVLAAAANARVAPAESGQSFARPPDSRAVLLGTSQAQPQEVSPPPVASPQQAERLAAARRSAEYILRSGQLTPENVETLRGELDQLPRDEAFEIRRRIAHAINTSQIVPTEIPFTLP